MISSNYIKLFAVLFALMVFSSSCRVWKTGSDTADTARPPGKTESTAPFSTKEPKVFQTKVVVTTFLDGTETRKKYFIAKNGEAVYIAFNHGEKNESAVLRDTDGKRSILDFKNKTFRETGENGTASATDSLRKFLTTKWLNEKSAVKFDDLGPDGGLKKYRVTFEGTKTSESLIFIDDKLNIPMKQEFYSGSGDKRILTYSVELSDFKAQPEDKWFKLPDGYKQVGASE
jgi:hypothetical protein